MNEKRPSEGRSIFQKSKNKSEKNLKAMMQRQSTGEDLNLNNKDKEDINKIQPPKDLIIKPQEPKEPKEEPKVEKTDPPTLSTVQRSSTFSLFKKKEKKEKGENEKKEKKDKKDKKEKKEKKEKEKRESNAIKKESNKSLFSPNTSSKTSNTNIMESQRRNTSTVPFELMDFKTRVKMVTGYDDIPVDKSNLKESLSNYFSNMEKLNRVKVAMQTNSKVTIQQNQNVTSKPIKISQPAEQLHDCINKQDKEEIKNIVKNPTAKKFIDEVDEQNLTPLLHAAFLLSISSPITVNGEDKSSNNSNIQPSLCIEICIILIEGGADANVSDKLSKNSVLHYICSVRPEHYQDCKLKYKQLLVYLINKISDINPLNDSNETPLHAASQNGNDAAVSILCLYRANNNIVNDKGFAPLHYCIKNENKINILALVEHGADVNLKTEAGSPLDLAKSIGTKEIIELLGGKMDKKTKRENRKSFHSHSTMRNRFVIKEKNVESILPKNDDSFLLNKDEGILIANLEQDCKGPPDLIMLLNHYKNNFYSKRHYCYIVNKENDQKIVAIQSRPVREFYAGIFINKYGIFDIQIPEEEISVYSILGVDDQEQIRQFLLQNWSFKHEMELFKLSVPKEVLSKMVKANVSKQALDWKLINDSLIPYFLLGLETKLGSKNQVTLGLIYAKEDQSNEEEMFNNPQPENPDHGFNQLCRILGEEIEIEGWKSFPGGFNPFVDKINTYYTSWRGFEIIYHISTMLSTNLQRQHIGNDKILIFYKEKGVPFNTTFRGDVNSVAFVVEPQYNEENKIFGWRLGCFYRKRIIHWLPTLPSYIITNPSLLKNYILANAINSIVGISRSPPYASRLDQLFIMEIQAICKKFLEGTPSINNKNDK